MLYHAGAIRLAGGDPAGRALVEQALALNPEFDLSGAAEARMLLAPPVDAGTVVAKRDDC